MREWVTAIWSHLIKGSLDVSEADSARMPENQVDVSRRFCYDLSV